ncbi:hypothetical protein V5799_024524 [Amblyomma americanum]|uniref:Uncharacterized protein n=1 Tax=Amblyomma americanum TaxID=6943 RepID=A0AAQ4ECB2_AMBAM
MGLLTPLLADSTRRSHRISGEQRRRCRPEIPVDDVTTVPANRVQEVRSFGALRRRGAFSSKKQLFACISALVE